MKRNTTFTALALCSVFIVLCCTESQPAPPKAKAAEKEIEHTLDGTAVSRIVNEAMEEYVALMTSEFPKHCKSQEEMVLFVNRLSPTCKLWIEFAREKIVDHGYTVEEWERFMASKSPAELKIIFSPSGGKMKIAKNIERMIKEGTRLCDPSKLPSLTTDGEGCLRFFLKTASESEKYTDPDEVFAIADPFAARCAEHLDGPLFNCMSAARSYNDYKACLKTFGVRD